MSVRISAVDWVPERGLSIEDSIAIAKMLKAHGCDLVDVSAGQTSTEARPQYGRMFQTPFSDAVRQEAGIATMMIVLGVLLLAALTGLRYRPVPGRWLLLATFCMAMAELARYRYLSFVPIPAPALAKIALGLALVGFGATAHKAR